MAGEPWEDMTADEKLAWRIERWRHPSVEFESPEAEAAYRARLDRLISALTLGRPDRVPIVLSIGLWPAKHAGMTPYDAMTDPVRAGQAWVDFIREFQPDAMSDLRGYAAPISMFEKLDYKLFAWPGHGIPKETGHQYNEKEWMGPNEYEALIADPTGYLLHTYLPRTVGAFRGFSGLSSFLDLISFPSVSAHLGSWGSPEMVDGLETLIAAAREVDNWARTVFPVLDQVRAMGFPTYRGATCLAPFDILGDTLRGTKGVIFDMFRQPEKVVEACERLVPMAIDWALKRPMPLPTPIVFIPLHKGADGFMNDEQFKTFYWPTLRKVVLGLIGEGTIPLLFAEGRYDSRLEVIMDLPKGKTVWLFDQTDMARAKRTIGQIACLEGNMPLSLLHAGTPEQVAAHTRKLIDTAADGGAYIMDIGAVADGGKAENLRAMIDTTKNYGVY
jgi:Uroporphyrinogen decarboxylase (URO-D)